MKKVLSVALASAMVLGMGANAFAISYNSSTNDEASWPKNFRFEGQLFVTNKDGDIVEDASTELNDNESVNFEPGDVIWMPLYADDQLVYDADYKPGSDAIDAVSNVKLADVVYNTSVVKSEEQYYCGQDGKWYTHVENDTSKNVLMTDKEKKELEAAGFHAPKTPTNGWQNWEKDVVNSIKSGVPAAGDKIMFDEVKRTVAKNSTRYYINGKQYKTEEAFEEALKNGEYTEKDVYVTVNLEKIDSVDDVVGKPVVEEEGTKLDYGHYTGNIDKNWSINLIEASTGVAELIEKAELYRATATDYASYSKYTDEIMPKAVYLKVTLKKEWKTADDETMKYYVYVAKNNGSTSDKTNEVWVSGTYENTDYEYVNFDWTNNANEAKLWKVRKGENGTAVFDFADKAFFTVKMYSEESMYLDLSTAYDKTIAGEMDVEADSFYKFDNENANFSRTGELVIVSDDDSLVPYSIEDGELVKVDAEYVENYAIAHTNTKVNGFVFKTKQLGNYVLATEEIDEEVEEPAKDEKPAEENKPAEEVKPDTKPNPETGAEDFVGLAVSLAVVSVAAAGALALKK